MKNLDTTKILKRLIIVSWVALGCCFLIKLLGGNIFEIVCNNQRFITICNYADNHLWAKMLIGGTYSFVSLYFYILAIAKQTKYNKIQLIMIIATTIIGTPLKIFSVIGGWIFDVWQFILLPCVVTIKNPKRHKFTLMALGFLLSFQLISMLVKNLGIGMVTNNGVLVTAIYSIDVTIMILLYYGYSNSIKIKKKEV